MPRKLLAPFLILTVSVLAPCATGCNRKPAVPVDQSKFIDAYNVDYQIKRLDSSEPAERISAMMWLKRCNKSDAQKAIPKLQEIAAKDKNASVKKMAQETISTIQGS
jgi:hypothetical protein